MMPMTVDIDSAPTGEEAHVEVTVPTPDPVPAVLEQPVEELGRHEHDRLGRLETRIDQLMTQQAQYVTRDEHTAAIAGRAPAEHNHDDRYLTLDRWDAETEPVDVDEEGHEEPAVVVPLPEPPEEEREEDKEDYKKLGLRW